MKHLARKRATDRAIDLTIINPFTNSSIHFGLSIAFLLWLLLAIFVPHASGQRPQPLPPTPAETPAEEIRVPWEVESGGESEPDRRQEAFADCLANCK